MVTKYERLLTAFRNGSELTLKQISARYGISDVYGMIFRMRNDGLDIRTNRRTNSKGEVKSFYSLNLAKGRRKAA